MIEVQEAVKIITDQRVDFGTEEISLRDSINRILREDWETDRPLPPYDRVTMDGIAIHFAAYAKGLRELPVVGVAAAGMEQQTLSDPDTCLEAMTGAILPRHCDTIIPYEHIEIVDGRAKLNEPVTEGQNVHYRGEDRDRGEVVVRSGTRISSAEIGVGASIGKTKVRVAKLPSVMVVSTGDELVEIDRQPLAHQIRRSNVYRTLTTLEAYNVRADNDHLPDDPEVLRDRITNYLRNYDVVIFSGGVSKGKYDYLPEILEELGVQKLFHKIKQRPGKPFWFGRHGREACTVFGFPGNPVSSFLCYHRYFTVWLDTCLQGHTPAVPKAVLTKDVDFKPDLTYFLEVKLASDAEGHLLATPVKGNGSGDLANLVDADAFIELPRGRDTYPAGEVFGVYRYRFNR